MKSRNDASKLESVVTILKEKKVLPVISLSKATLILPLAHALKAAGINSFEITFRHPCAAEAIMLLREAMPEAFIAAGTILNAEDVRRAKLAGADLLIAPGFNPRTVESALSEGMAFIPGVNHPMAIEAALNYGLDLVKFFPAQASGGVEMLKALLAPYHSLKVIPTGGISLDNIGDYLAIPQVVACGTSAMVREKLLQSEDWLSIEKCAGAFLQAVVVS